MYSDDQDMNGDDVVLHGNQRMCMSDDEDVHVDAEGCA